MSGFLRSTTNLGKVGSAQVVICESKIDRCSRIFPLVGWHDSSIWATRELWREGEREMNVSSAPQPLSIQSKKTWKVMSAGEEIGGAPLFVFLRPYSGTVYLNILSTTSLPLSAPPLRLLLRYQAPWHCAALALLWNCGNGKLRF